MAIRLPFTAQAESGDERPSTGAVITMKQFRMPAGRSRVTTAERRSGSSGTFHPSVKAPGRRVAYIPDEYITTLRHCAVTAAHRPSRPSSWVRPVGSRQGCELRRSIARASGAGNGEGVSSSAVALHAPHSRRRPGATGTGTLPPSRARLPLRVRTAGERARVVGKTCPHTATEEGPSTMRARKRRVIADVSRRRPIAEAEPSEQVFRPIC
jgi:hypothetical protein